MCSLDEACLPSKPVLEMALCPEKFEREVQELLEQGRVREVEYVLLKIAMEIQDKANMQNLLKQKQNPGGQNSTQEIDLQ